jgi:hypothetical protein
MTGSVVVTVNVGVAGHGTCAARGRRTKSRNNKPAMVDFISLSFLKTKRTSKAPGLGGPAVDFHGVYHHVAKRRRSTWAPHVERSHAGESSTFGLRELSEIQ